jgi:hypothetical protein
MPARLFATMVKAETTMAMIAVIRAMAKRLQVSLNPKILAA